MMIKINLVEAASELAHDAMIADLTLHGLITREDQVWEGENYKKDYQVAFNLLEEYYRDKLETFKIK